QREAPWVTNRSPTAGPEATGASSTTVAPASIGGSRPSGGRWTYRCRLIAAPAPSGAVAPSVAGPYGVLPSRAASCLIDVPRESRRALPEVAAVTDRPRGTGVRHHPARPKDGAALRGAGRVPPDRAWSRA